MTEDGRLFATQVRGGDKKAINKLVRLVKKKGRRGAALELGVTERSIYNYFKLPLVRAAVGNIWGAV